MNHVHNILSYATPFLLAAIGGLFTEISGMLNIALEGLMLCGAFFGILGTMITGSLFLGILIAVTASMLLALMYGYLSIKLESNFFITGLGTNLFAAGMATLISKWYFGVKGNVTLPDSQSLSAVNIPILEKIPVLNQLFSGYTIITYLSWFIVIGAVIVIYKTSFGLNLRAAGYSPQVLRSNGANPDKYKLAAIIISGATCGLAGAQLSLKLGSWVPNITAGRGWIALVAIYLGFKHPIGVATACIVFALAEYLGIALQNVQGIPESLMPAFPYFITLLALGISTVVRKKIGK